MNQAFENPENRKLMAFYYQNFGPVADHLTKHQQLDQLLPEMLKVNDFNDYINTCFFAVDLASQTGFYGDLFKQYYDSFEGEIEELPSPNIMFDKLMVN